MLWTWSPPIGKRTMPPKTALRQYQRVSAKRSAGYFNGLRENRMNLFTTFLTKNQLISGHFWAFPLTETPFSANISPYGYRLGHVHRAGPQRERRVGEYA